MRYPGVRESTQTKCGRTHDQRSRQMADGESLSQTGRLATGKDLYRCVSKTAERCRRTPAWGSAKESPTGSPPDVPRPPNEDSVRSSASSSWPPKRPSTPTTPPSPNAIARDSPQVGTSAKRSEISLDASSPRHEHSGLRGRHTTMRWQPCPNTIGRSARAQAACAYEGTSAAALHLADVPRSNRRESSVFVLVPETLRVIGLPAMLGSRISWVGPPQRTPAPTDAWPHLISSGEDHRITKRLSQEQSVGERGADNEVSLVNVAFTAVSHFNREATATLQKQSLRRSGRILCLLLSFTEMARVQLLRSNACVSGTRSAPRG